MANPRYTPQYAGNQPRPGLTAMAMANPLEDVLSQVEQFGQRAGMELAAENATEAVLSGEQPSMKLPITPAAVAYNRAATEAYAARTESDLRGKVAELSAQFPGRSPSDPDSFAKMFDAHASSLLASVPEGMRGRIGLEVQARRQMALAGITDAAQRFEFQRNVSSLEAALEADIEEAAIAARDGASPDIIGALYARADGRVDELVSLGVINAEEGALKKAERRALVQAEAIFGDATRSGNIAGVLSELERGGPIAEGLTLKARDRLATRLSAEFDRRRVEANRFAAEADAATKEQRDLLTTKMWAAVYSPNEAERPSIDQIVRAQEAGILEPADAEQMIRTRATTREARTDLPTLDLLETLLAEGVDIGPQIGEAIRAGKLHPEDASGLREKNTTRQGKGLPDPIATLRKDALSLYRETGMFADAYKEGEQERKIDAVQFFDEQVRSAPDGKDPETGLSFREMAARQAFQVLRERKDEASRNRLRMIPPKMAVVARDPKDPLAPPRLNRAATLSALRAQVDAGSMSEDELDEELELVERWQRAGMVTP